MKNRLHIILCLSVILAFACLLIVSTLPSGQTVVNTVAGNADNFNSQGIARTNRSVSLEDDGISHHSEKSKLVVANEMGTKAANRSMAGSPVDSFESRRNASPRVLAKRNSPKSAPETGVYKSDISNTNSDGYVSQRLVEKDFQVSAGGGDFMEVVQEGHKPLAAELRSLNSQSLLSPELTPALAQADAAFAEVIAESGIINPSDPSYFDVWQRAARRSDDILRAWLGWDSFNALSAQARTAALASIGNPESQ